MRRSLRALYVFFTALLLVAAPVVSAPPGPAAGDRANALSAAHGFLARGLESMAADEYRRVLATDGDVMLGGLEAEPAGYDLRDTDTYVFTLNGFPYGAFHATRVKEHVYLPDWRDRRRLRRDARTAAADRH